MQPVRGGQTKKHRTFERRPEGLGAPVVFFLLADIERKRKRVAITVHTPRPPASTAPTPCPTPPTRRDLADGKSRAARDGRDEGFHIDGVRNSGKFALGRAEGHSGGVSAAVVPRPPQNGVPHARSHVHPILACHCARVVGSPGRRQCPVAVRAAATCHHHTAASRRHRSRWTALRRHGRHRRRQQRPRRARRPPTRARYAGLCGNHSAADQPGHQATPGEGA